MRIAIFTNNYLPNPFGVSSSIESFRKEFEKMGPASTRGGDHSLTRGGHTVYVFAPEAKGYVDENPNVFRYPSVNINYKISFPLAIPYSGKVDKVLEELDIDIIHSQHPNLLGWTARKWAKKKNIPLIFTWHTLYDKYTHFAPPFIPQKLANWWVVGNATKYANGADVVVTPTESVKKIIISWGVKNKNIAVVSTGVEKYFENVDKEIIRKKYEIAEDEIVLFTNSRLTSEKNVEFLVSVVANILKKNDKLKFMVISDGYLLNKLKEIVKKAEVFERVIFCGHIEKKELGNYYAAGDIFVYASKSETQGMVISEAMISGLPVVAVSATGVSDQVMDGASGFLVDEKEEEFSKALEKLLKDDVLRKRFSENARKIALENYTSEICAKRMLTLYEKAIENKKSLKM